MSAQIHQAGWIESTAPARLLKIGPQPDDHACADHAGHLRVIVETARQLLDYAVEHGLVDSPAIIDPIIKIESELDADAVPDALTRSEFLKSYNALCKITQGVSAETLSVAAKRDQQRTRHIYFLCLSALLLLAIPLTTISTIGGKLSTDAAAQITATCKDYPVLYCDPSTRNQETSYDHYPFSVNDLTSRTSHISQSLWVLAFFVDLFQSENMHADLAGVSPQHNQNIWSSFIETFNRSGVIIDRFKLYYGTLSNYILPIVFGMLGAVTFGLRELRQKTEPPTWGRRGGALAILRICIAGLAGYLITVTAGFTPDLQISPIFVAFLLGYSIDVFFTLLDRAVARFKAPSSGQAGDVAAAAGVAPSIAAIRRRPRPLHA
jgi:hypothetical protein